LSYSSEVLADSPVAYWKLDETSSAAPTAADAAGGTAWTFGTGVVGGQTAVVPDGGTSVHGDGVNPICTLASVPTAVNGANVTLEAWVHLPGTNVKGSFVKVGSSSNGWGMGIGGTQWDNVGQKLILLSETVAWHPTTYTFPGAGNYHVMAVRGALGAVTAYVNGTSVWTGTLSSPVTASGQMGVGGYSEGFGFKLSSSVTIDNVAIYASALSSSRVTAHYNSGSGDNSAVTADSPTVWLKLDETSTQVGAFDSSGNGRLMSYSATVPVIGQTSLLGDGSGKSVTINSTAQYLTIASASWMDTTSGLTVEGRIQPTSGVLTAGGFIASRWGGAGGTKMWLLGVTSAGKLTASVNTGGVDRTVTGTTTLTAGTNYTVTLEWTSGGNLEIFLNGVSEGTVSAPGAIATPSTPIELGRAALTGGSGLTWGGGIDEVSVTPSVLSTSRLTARHAAAVASSVTTVNAPLLAGSSDALDPAVSSSASVAAPALAGASDMLDPVVTTGSNVDVAAPVLAAASDVVDPTVAVVSNVSIVAPLLGSQGAVLVPTVGAGADASVAAPVLAGTGTMLPPAVITGDSTGAELLGGGTLSVSALRTVDVVVMGPVTLAGGGTLTTDSVLPVVPMTDVTLRGGGTITARPASEPRMDPRTGIDQWRYVFTDLQDTPLGEIVDLEHDPVEDGIGEPGTMSFKIPSDLPERSFINPVTTQCQVWQGDALLLKGPVLPGEPSQDGTTITYKVQDPSWFWREGRRTIGRIPKQNLLKNGDFTLPNHRYWDLGYDSDSIPKADPVVTIVADDFTDGGKAAEIHGVETVTETKAELQSSAVYWPNRPFAWEPLANGFRPGGEAAVDAVANAMPTTAGLKVTIVGHTANDGTGNGLALSLRRAEAAKARVLAKRPGAIVTTKGVGFYDPNPAYPIDSQQQRRVVISYESTTTISGKSKQWMHQRVKVTQPKSAAYPLELTAAAWLKIMDDWSVQDANMVSIKVEVRRASAPTKVLDDLTASTSISDTDPINRWMKETAAVTIPADGREYWIDVYLYAPAALARYTRAALVPTELLYFWGVDQALIVKGIVEHMQDPAMGHGWPIHVGTRTPLTGVKRDRPYPHYERRPVETALDEFPSLYRGMDIDTLTTPTTTTVATFYPRQGQVVDYQLVQGGNVALAVPASTRDVGSSVIAQAQDPGPARDEAYAKDSRAFGGLNLERVITAEQETPINELDETAAAELGWAKMPTPAYWLDIDPECMAEVLAATRKGDTCRLLLDYPDQVDRLARIVKRQIHPKGLRLMVSIEEA
jgi:hypothetical protein